MVRRSVEAVAATLRPQGPHTMTNDRLASFELIEQSTFDGLMHQILTVAAGRIDRCPWHRALALRAAPDGRDKATTGWVRRRAAA